MLDLTIYNIILLYVYLYKNIFVGGQKRVNPSPKQFWPTQGCLSPK